jgi:hypothetical protein
MLFVCLSFSSLLFVVILHDLSLLHHFSSLLFVVTLHDLSLLCLFSSLLFVVTLHDLSLLHHFFYPLLWLIQSLLLLSTGSEINSPDASGLTFSAVPLNN